jgi:hypothetical protein
MLTKSLERNVVSATDVLAREFASGAHIQQPKAGHLLVQAGDLGGCQHSSQGRRCLSSFQFPVVIHAVCLLN